MLGGACAPALTRESEALVAGEVLHPDSVVIRVANRSPGALTVRLLRDGIESPLGEVAAGGEARYPMRAGDITPAQVAFAVTPPASNESLRTAPFAVQPGQIVWFEIAPRLVDSRVLIRWPRRCETCADPLRSPTAARR